MSAPFISSWSVMATHSIQFVLRGLKQQQGRLYRRSCKLYAYVNLQVPYFSPCFNPKSTCWLLTGCEGCFKKLYSLKKLPANQRVVGLKEAKGGGENESSAFVFLQEIAAFAGRIQTEDNNHGYKNDGR
jgi:hypothetical protein